jgi:peptidoglycan/LPS O-acetylase OafA/YrhL
MVSHTPMIRTRSALGLTSRLILTVAGAAGLIVGAFLKWNHDIKGTDLSWHALYQSTFTTAGDIWRTIGGASIALGIVAVLGLAERTGWLTRLAGAVGLVGFILFVIEAERSGDHGLQLGSWLAVAGSVACVMAGMAGGTTATILEE